MGDLLGDEFLTQESEQGRELGEDQQPVIVVD
jgi:hypothetical protein